MDKMKKIFGSLFLNMRNKFLNFFKGLSAKVKSKLSGA